MKTLIKIIGIAAALGLGLSSLPTPIRAATTPSLGAASSYAILSSTYTNTVVGTKVNGDIGFTTGPAVAPAGVHANYGSGSPYAIAGANQGTALSALATQLCTFTFAPGPIDLSTDITHGASGVYEPGVYCSTGAMDVGGPLTLNGSGTYIFRTDGALTSTAGAVITLTGASACDVFWTPTQATTLAANTNFVGTIISDAGITIGANTTLTGQALAFGGTVTTDTDTISVPVCSTTANLRVIKEVILNNGGNATAASFNLHVKLFGIDVAGSPAAGSIAPGTSYSLSAGTYTVSEDVDVLYSSSFSGDCDINGNVTLFPGDNKVCTITNDDLAPPSSGGGFAPPVPPLIYVIKVPDPLSLPAGPGLVSYTYTLSNIGTVPVSDITMAGDTCPSIFLAAGDTNNDGVLAVDETWVYRCATTLTETHTNTVVATGRANGLMATDIASATVIVGIPVVPPLIHVTKIPNPLTLPAGGGMVTYTKRVTNPGTVPLTNVRLTDDKCGPINYVSGDTNNDSRLDVNETWLYTCRTNLTSTITNTAVASGDANGLTATDFAIATVVVAPPTPTIPVTANTTTPKLPDTGFAPDRNNLPKLPVLAILVVSMFSILLLKNRLRKPSGHNRLS